MNMSDVSVEAVWPSPGESVLFLQLCEIYIQIKNNLSVPIEIQKIECHFQHDDADRPSVPTIKPYLILEPGHISEPIPLRFETDITWRTGTNNYRFVIHYHDGSPKEFHHEPRKYLILKPAGPNEIIFFISHKDQEDTNIGRCLANFLRKLGFIGYLSEDTPHPGVDLWKEKIPSTIESSIAMVILWTNKASKNPEKIYREINIAKSCGKKLIVAREKGVPDPSGVSKDIEYFPVSRPITALELKQLAISIEKTYRRGGYTKIN